jgi:hypothetical protein
MVAFNPQTHVKVISSIAPGAKTGATAGRGVDALGYTHALVILDTATVGDTVTVTVQASASVDTGYAAITGAAFTAITSANDDKVYAGVVYLPSVARYIRANAAFAGPTSSSFSVTIVLFNPEDTDISTVQAAYASGSTTAAADANVLSYAFAV